jgi:hypothetical protein
MSRFQRVSGLPGLVSLVVAIGLFAWAVQGHAADWFDDFSDGNADAPPVQWSSSPVFSGDYNASSGDYVLTPTDDPSQPAGTDDETLIATVNSVVYTDTSIQTQAVVGVSETPDPNKNADFDASGLVTGGDFLIWQTGTGGPGTQSQGDADFSGQIDGADLTIWQDQFGLPPNLRGGNVGVVARFNPVSGNGYLVLMDDGNQWNLLQVESFGLEQFKFNEGDDDAPIDPVTGASLNAANDLMIRLDVTGAGTETLLEVWFWSPDQPMPTEPYRSYVDDFNGVGGIALINEGPAGIIYNEDDANTPGIFRFVETSGTLAAAAVISTVPEPASGALAVLTVLAMILRMRSKRGA